MRAPPPTVSCASNTSTEKPRRASSAAAVSPLGPAPTTTASSIDGTFGLLRQPTARNSRIFRCADSRTAGTVRADEYGIGCRTSSRIDGRRHGGPADRAVRRPGRRRGAVAWCSPLPTSRPRYTSMSPVSVTCPLHNGRILPGLSCGISLPASTLRRACLTRCGIGAPAPNQRSANASGPGDTTFSIMIDWGCKSCRDRRPGAPLRGQEEGNGLCGDQARFRIPA